MLKRALGFNLLDVSFVLFAGFFAFICFYPMWYVFVVSITPYEEYIMKEFVFAPPRSPSFLYYYSIIVGGRDIFIQTMSVSFLKTFVGSTVSVLVTAMFAYGVSKRYLMGTRTLNVLMVFTLFFSGGLIPTYILMIQLRLIDTFWVMVLPWIVNTGHFIIMRNYFSYTVPTELEDAALIDGSSEFRTFFTIVFPISKAMFAAIFLFEGGVALERLLQFSHFREGHLADAVRIPVAPRAGVLVLRDVDGERTAIRRGYRCLSPAQAVGHDDDRARDGAGDDTVSVPAAAFCEGHSHRSGKGMRRDKLMPVLASR